MSIHITVKCPVCGEDLEVEATVIQDEEGAAPPWGPPGGLHQFMALDNYECETMPEHVDCWKQIDADPKLESKLEDSIAEEAVKAYYDADNDDGPDYDYDVERRMDLEDLIRDDLS